jgi:hypothetical protein
MAANRRTRQVRQRAKKAGVAVARITDAAIPTIEVPVTWPEGQPPPEVFSYFTGENSERYRLLETSESLIVGVLDLDGVENPAVPDH